MYALAIFIFLMSVLLGIPQTLRANQMVAIADLRADARAENLRIYQSGAVEYAVSDPLFTGVIPHANIMALLPSWYVPNGDSLWVSQVRTYGTQRMVVTAGAIPGGGIEKVQRRTRSMACGVVNGGAIIAPRPNSNGIVAIGPGSTPAINFNQAPYNIGDGSLACIKVIG
jgi:hypothetical protein